MVAGLTTDCASAGRLKRSSHTKITVQEETYRRAGVGACRRTGFAGDRRVRSRLSGKRAMLIGVDCGHVLCGSGLVAMNFLSASARLTKEKG